MATRRPRQKVDGVLLLDKPSGMTSNGALQVARRLFDADKAGHTGTLDPFATGLLPLCFGEATKFAQSLLDAPKSYVADVHFGVRTTTGDIDGDVLAEAPVDVDAAAIEAALPRFRGSIAQVPPMHSALKRDGKPLLRLCPQGHRPRAHAARSRDQLAYARVLAGTAGDAAHQLQQGNLYPRAGRRPGRGARLRRAPGGAAAHRRPAASRWPAPSRSTSLPIRHRTRARRCCCRSRRCSARCRRSMSIRRWRWRCAMARRSPRLPWPRGRYRCRDARKALIGVVEAVDGVLHARRLCRTGAPQAGEAT